MLEIINNTAGKFFTVTFVVPMKYSTLVPAPSNDVKLFTVTLVTPPAVDETNKKVADATPVELVCLNVTFSTKILLLPVLISIGYVSP